MDLYASIIMNETAMMIEGSSKQVARVKTVSRRSEAYSSIEDDILHSVSELA